MREPVIDCYEPQNLRSDNGSAHPDRNDGLTLLQTDHYLAQLMHNLCCSMPCKAYTLPGHDHELVNACM